MPSIYALKPAFQSYLRPLVRVLAAAGITANQITVLALVLLGPRELLRLPRIVPATAAVLIATAVMHAVFFGAGRYGLVVVPFVSALAFVRPRGAPSQG